MRQSSEIEKLERRWMENPMGVTFAPLAEAYRRAGDHARALEVLAIGLAQHPAYVPALIVQARCHLDGQSDDAAEASFMAALQSDPHNLIALKSLADICERTGRPGDAKHHLGRLLDADPAHQEAREQFERVAALVAEPASPPVAPESPSLEAMESVAMLTDFEATVIDADVEGEEPGVASLLVVEEAGTEPEVVEVGETTESLVSDGIDGSTDQQMEVEHAAEDLEPTGWDAASLLAVEVPDLPFDEDAPVAALDPAPEAEEVEPDEPEVQRLPDVEWEADMVSMDSGDLAIAPVDLGESMDSPSLTQPVEEEALSPDVPLESEATSKVPAPADEQGGDQADTPAVGMPSTGEAGAGEASVLDDPISASAEGLDPVVEGTPPREDWPGSDRDTAVWGEPVDAAPEAGEAEPVATGDWMPWGRDATEDPSPEPVADEVAVPEAAAEPHVESDAELPADADAGADEDDPVQLVEGAEAEIPTDAPPVTVEGEPELVITETMAEVFLRQGHRAMALAVYAQLAERDPGNERIRKALDRLSGELAAPRHPTGGATAGESAGELLARVLAPEPPPLPPIEPASEGGPPTRPAVDPLSLSAVFGDDPLVPGSSSHAGGGGDSSGEGPSFDEFFGPGEGSEGSAESEGAKTGGEDDLDQFNAWLRSLKR